MISAVAAPMLPGTVFGPYRIANVAGGAAVGEAIHSGTNERVAVKRLPDALAAEPSRLAAFRKFIDAVQALQHPRVLRVRDTSAFDGGAIQVMDFAPRGSLADAVRKNGRFMWAEATRSLIEISRAAEASHAAGLVHGAIRPSNVLVATDGTIRVSDFAGEWLSPRTADYAAPEGRPTVAADIYSLGATYFALLTGHAPFADAPDDAALRRAHAERGVPPVRAENSEIPLRCEMIIQRAMAKKPDERYPSVAALRADLESVLLSASLGASSRPPPPRVPPPVNGWRRRLTGWRISLTPILLVLLAAAAAYFTFWRPTSRTAKPRQEAPVVVTRPTFRNALGMMFVQPPVGAFDMGGALQADGRPHTIRITKPFAIGIHEVTQAQFQSIMGNNPSAYPSDGGPVDSVTWEDARQFCEKLSQHEAERRAGRTYRLPTEAEWEYCCRAGSPGPFAFGGRLGIDRANTRMSGLTRPMPPGNYPPNAWGIYDMHGNLWEWCGDWYSSDYYLESPINDPPGPASGIRRVLRGGAWNSPPDQCTSAHRGDLHLPTHRGSDVGFRVVCIGPELEPDDGK